MDFTTKLAEIHVRGREGSAIEAVNVGEVGSLYRALQGMRDGRKRRGRRYPAAAMLTIIVMSKMAGESTLVGIAEFAQLRLELLCGVFGLRRLPCANTYCYICEHIELAELNQAHCGYFRQTASNRGNCPAAKAVNALGYLQKRRQSSTSPVTAKSCAGPIVGHALPASYRQPKPPKPLPPKPLPPKR